MAEVNVNRCRSDVVAVNRKEAETLEEQNNGLEWWEAGEAGSSHHPKLVRGTSWQTHVRQAKREPPQPPLKVLPNSCPATNLH